MSSSNSLKFFHQELERKTNDGRIDFRTMHRFYDYGIYRQGRYHRLTPVSNTEISSLYYDRGINLTRKENKMRVKKVYRVINGHKIGMEYKTFKDLCEFSQKELADSNNRVLKKMFEQIRYSTYLAVTDDYPRSVLEADFRRFSERIVYMHEMESLTHRKAISLYLRMCDIYSDCFTILDAQDICMEKII